jgi:uncharacterized membrane protein YedE/YeeE
MTENFLLVRGLAGGIGIGLAAAIMILLNGRIAGISGIVAGIGKGLGADSHWRIVFVVGLPLGAILTAQLHGLVPQIHLDASPMTLAIAGVLVGFGTRMGAGCTSGHGVCGLARLSKRSIIATCTFMFSAAIVVYFTRHVFAS